MQQRVGLARAFATDAEILLMDEPFSALDPLIRDKLQDELLELQATLKRTIVFVSHDLDEALKLGNRIAILEGGRIVQVGTGEDILLKPADAYVAEFVKHMNPLNVLRGNAVMRPAAELMREGATVLIDRAGRVRVALDVDDRPVAVTLDGAAGRITTCVNGYDEASIGLADILVASVDVKLRSAIRAEAVHRTPYPAGRPARAACGSLRGRGNLQRSAAPERCLKALRSACISSMQAAA